MIDSGICVVSYTAKTAEAFAGENGMSKGNSGLFQEEKGFMRALGEDVYELIMPNSEKVQVLVNYLGLMDVRLRIG